MKNPYLLNPHELAQARLGFQQLRIIGPESGDRFFEAFGVGNVLAEIDRPYERFHDYEFLLSILRDDDPEKYREIHKGTAFYVLGWAAFDLRDYERAVFYMDAALSEDERKSFGRFEEFMSNPVGQFLRLELGRNQTAKRITSHLRTLIERQLNRFSSVSPSHRLDLEAFVEKFVMTIARKREARSIITAFYGFALEFEDRWQMLHLRGKEGGSIEPILTHLFKGGLIFESLLKHLYAHLKNGTLGGISKDANFQIDFFKFDASAQCLSEIVRDISDSSVQTAFNTTAKLRNTTGHNLIWEDVFEDPENFLKLFEQEINAIFYVIQKKYL